MSARFASGKRPYVTVEVFGMKQLEQELKQLSDKLRRKALSRGVAAGARMCRKLAKQKAQGLGLVDSGDMVKAISLKRKKSRDRNVAIYGVGYSGLGWYGRLYEYGFKNPEGGKRQRPVIRPTLDEHAEEIAYAIKNRMWEEIVKIRSRGILKPRR